MSVIKPVNGKNHDNWPSCSKMNKAGTSLWIKKIFVVLKVIHPKYYKDLKKGAHQSGLVSGRLAVHQVKLIY